MFMNDEVCFLFLDPQNGIGPSISFSVVLCSFVLLVYIVTISFLLLFSTYALQPSRLIVRSGLDVPTFATRRLHAWAPSGEKWARNVREFCLKCRLPLYIQGSFTCRKTTTWDRRLYFPSEGACWEFFRPKIPTASDRCEPANLHTKGQHATSRPPKLLTLVLVFCVCVSILRNTLKNQIICHVVELKFPKISIALYNTFTVLLQITILTLF
jgi:hypothetical protein